MTLHVHHGMVAGDTRASMSSFLHSRDVHDFQPKVCSCSVGLASAAAAPVDLL